MPKLKRLFLVIIFLLGLRFPQNVEATNFYIDAHYHYAIENSGKTNAEINISIENNTSEKLAKSYLLNLHNFEPTNISIEEVTGEKLHFQEVRRDGNSLLEIEFDEPEAGIGKRKSFLVKFDSYTFAKKIGDTWDISIPKIDSSDEKRDYSVSILVPKSLGQEAFIAPSPSERIDNENDVLYKYSKNKLLAGNVNLTFGEFQTYSFDINYHLENPQEQSQEVELAIPPDTTYQRIFYKEIRPEPKNIYRDIDGNWIAKFDLSSKERLSVYINGYVNIFPFPRSEITTTDHHSLLENIKSTEFWNTTDPQIKSLANQLKSPEAIYNFVVSTLSYDYERMYGEPERLGATQALNNKEQALCREFSDLFITLARAAGIPAREINGYAYSNNPKIQPLSLVADVLHSWPEYWDEELQIWVPVDPTWDSTTGGRDYFNNFDVNHFAFVIHGSSDTTPYPPGSYKLGSSTQKDIEIKTTDVPVDFQENLEVESKVYYKRLSIHIPFEAVIKNNSSSAIYNKKVYLYQDDDLVKSIDIEILPPYGKFIIEEQINYGLFGSNAPFNMKVIVGDIESSAYTHKSDVLIFRVLILLGVLSLIILAFFVKTKPNFNLQLLSRLEPIKKKLIRSWLKFKHRKEPIYHETND